MQSGVTSLRLMLEVNTQQSELAPSNKVSVALMNALKSKVDLCCTNVTEAAEKKKDIYFTHVIDK